MAINRIFSEIIMDNIDPREIAALEDEQEILELLENVDDKGYLELIQLETETEHLARFETYRIDN